MPKKRGAGRPCEADEARTETWRIRLTKAEREAIEKMEINFTEMVRGMLAVCIRTASAKGLPRAS